MLGSSFSITGLLACSRLNRIDTEFEKDGLKNHALYQNPVLGAKLRNRFAR
jgi:hypothetical protein